MMTIADWKNMKATGNSRVTFVSILGEARHHATIQSVAATGVRVKFLDTGNVERVHPDDLRPGWV